MHILAVIVAVWATVLASSPASAELAGRWTATSTASMAITGNITLSGNTLTFGNATSLELTKVAERIGRWSPVGGIQPGTIYKLTPPSDPALLNGNTLCGMKEPVTYIVLSEFSERSLSLSVFTAPNEPKHFGDHTCASYFYER